MRVGASYYPEVIRRDEWERDLESGRQVGLTALRCGEFAWSAFDPDGFSWDSGWALEFLDLAHQYGYSVIWCTPSATPPPYLFDRWPDLHAFNQDDRWTPVGIRRHYCPTHTGYRDLCGQTAERLARDLCAKEALVGWQVDNELAGDGFTCWCPRCGRKFRKWLENQYGTLDALNEKWQTGVWSQVYTRWEQIPVPHRCWNHAPALKMDYRRFRSDNWLAFYRTQRDALHDAGASMVTTNFYNLTWDMPFDQWKWRPFMDAIGCSHYEEDKTVSRFQLAELRGARPGDCPLWVLEQKAGQQSAQNFYPEELSRLERHLQICAENGAEYAIYWHLRQHSAGCEMEHGAVLRHDGKLGRVAHAIQEAILAISGVQSEVPKEDALLVFSFEQQWANENRPQPGTRWNYRVETQDCWFRAARQTLGPIRVGSPADVANESGVVLAPFCQVNEPGMFDGFKTALEHGAVIITTADLWRLDAQNNVRRIAPLADLTSWGSIPDFELMHLRPEYSVDGTLLNHPYQGRLFWYQSDEWVGGTGRLEMEATGGPAALSIPVGAGLLLISLTAPDREGVAALIGLALEFKGRNKN